MRRYATPEDLTAYLGPGMPPPEDAEALLADASEDIDRMLLSARYAVDVDGMPTAPHVVEAITRATCAQAVYLDDVGDRSGASGLWDSASLGSASYGRAAGAGGAGAGSGAGFGPRALRALQAAGLTGHPSGRG